jgi:glycosyltransferase involved in cell wall biosynthesis/SAM-dependent methyltransferase
MADDQLGALRAAQTPGPHHVSEEAARTAPEQVPVRVIATYLPQFHPIPENDAWWGRGFTEWANVIRGMPRWPGHHQPILPADLGFYDLRLADTIRRQAEMARRYGIHGFCFHTYWFGGKRLLETPLELLLRNPEIELPFCLCWANENWTRRWDGLDAEVLIAQQHSPEDDIAFIRAMEPALRDTRYIRIGGRPVLIVYRPHLLPDPLATARRWRVYMAEAGLGDPYLAMVQAFSRLDPRPIGFDAAMEFPPHKLGFGRARAVRVQPFEADYTGTALDYAHMVENAIAQEAPPYRLFYGVCPRWDNEARKPGRGTTFANATPDRYRHWLTAACDRTMAEQPEHERLIFVNSWNEWAEGAQLEPDRHFGHAFLSATAEVMCDLAERVRPDGPPSPPPTPKPKPAAARAPMQEVLPPALRAHRSPHVADRLPRLALIVHDAHFHGAQMLAVNLARRINGSGLATLQLLLGEGGELESAMAKAAPTRRVGAGFADVAAWQRMAEELAADGVRAALVNTVVSAQVLPALRGARLRTVCLVHELPQLIADYRLEEPAREIARHADVVVFPSESVRLAFVGAFGEVAGESLVLPQGLYRTPLPEQRRPAARAAVRARLGIGDDATLVIGLGFGDHRKGLDLWPAIAQELAKLRPGVRLVWVGALEMTLEQELKAAIATAGLEQAILLPGRTDTPEEFLAAADVFLLTSREDPFPSAALEAAAHGVPIVCFDGSGGMPGFVRETGLVPVPMADAAAAAAAIDQLAADPMLRAAAGAAGTRLVAERFDFQAYAAELVRLAEVPNAVTAVVPNYNYARHLPARLRSIWRQTHPVAEIIVLDDASTDDSLAVIERLRAASPVRMRIVANEANSGSVSRQWAKGLALARTPLVWIAEADDLSEPTFLERLVGQLACPNVVMAYSQSKMIDSDGAVTAADYLSYTHDVDPALWRSDYVRSGLEEIARALSVKNTIPNVSAAVLRRDVAQQVLDVALEEMVALRNTADWLFFMRLLSRGDIAFCAEALNLHRRHAGGVTISSANLDHLEEIARMQAIAAQLASVTPVQVAAAAAFRVHAARHFGLPEPEAAAERAGALAAVTATDDAWLDAIIDVAEGRGRHGLPRSLLPDLPDPALQILTTSQAGRDTLLPAFEFYRDCRNGFARHGRPIKKGDVLLDFGVGWGRIGRFFLRDINPADLIGIDVNPDSIAECRRLFDAGRFEVCPPRPPGPLAEGSVDFCIAYSVFSHLSHDACDAWMREFHRIVRPGGMIAVTTRGRWFFDYCEALSRDPAATGYTAALGALFPDVDAARRRYDAGELVFATSLGVSGGGPLDKSFYGETWIPEAYAERAWLPELELVEFLFEPGRQIHPILFLRRQGECKPPVQSALPARPPAASAPAASPAPTPLVPEPVSLRATAAPLPVPMRRAPALRLADRLVRPGTIARWAGFCPICQRDTVFSATDPWFRDSLVCEECPAGSIPRERALMQTIRELLPDYARLDIHESSPGNRGVSPLLAAEAPGYVPTQFFPGVTLGSMHRGVRCEDLERQTFASESFDLVVTQDVMEHVFRPDRAYVEVFRTLRPGGLYIHTTPIYKELVETRRCATLNGDGSVTHHESPEYHGNPVSNDGALLTFRFGYDIGELIARWTPFDVGIRRFYDRTHGIVAEFCDVIVCRKPAA